MKKTLEKVKKRSGKVVAFDERKIMEAIWKAAKSQGGNKQEIAEELAGLVRGCLEKEFNNKKVPSIENVQDFVERVLIDRGHVKTAKAYILYREKRNNARAKLKIRRRRIPTAMRNEMTDMALMVNSETHDDIVEWDRDIIVRKLQKEGDLDQRTAEKIAASVENRIINSGMERISTSLIRELIDNELFERGLNFTIKKQHLLGIPKYDLENLIFAKSKENSNIAANTPEAINLSIAEHLLKKYALQEIFSSKVADAHKMGKIHLHDLGYPTRVYCSSHSIEYIKKYGLRLENLDTTSFPAKHARTLTGHLNTFLASIQTYYAGALGVAYINIFYAPYLEGMTEKELKQEAQHLIFSSSQSAFSRGGQTLFLDFNIHTGIPEYMKNIQAIGPGGKYTGKTYGDYGKTAQRFCKALLNVWREGDKNGHPFVFPKCDFHITEETFSDPNQLELLRYACQIAGENGSIYFIFDRNEVTLSACCRLRTTIEDDYMLKHPESMRFCGFQNVTINLPQAAYRVGKEKIEAFYDEIEKMVDIAIEAHLEKKSFIKEMMSSSQMPLWQMGKKAADGRPYIDLNEASYIVGLIGLNEAIYYLSGKELHDSPEQVSLGLKIIAKLNVKIKKEGKRLGMKIVLEESPAESASRRLAKLDLKNFPEAERVVRGSIEDDECYYTNSIHLRADAPVDILTRIREQSKFHSMIEAGAIIHAFIGEERPPASSIFNLVQKTFMKTQAAQFTVSPEFTICDSCQNLMPELLEKCESCNSTKVYGVSRIVGYYSRINNWNKSKLGELRDRRLGNYSISQTKKETKEKKHENRSLREEVLCRMQ